MANDLTSKEELVVGYEHKIRRWCFFYLETGYSYLGYGEVKGDEKWSGKDEGYPNKWGDPIYAHAPPTDPAFTYPYDGTIERKDVVATHPDGRSLDVNLSGIIIRAGLGLYVF